MNRKSKTDKTTAKTTRKPTRPRNVTLTIDAPIEAALEGERVPQTLVAVFDEADMPLGFAAVEQGVAKLALPQEIVGRAVKVFHAPVEDELPRPTVQRLRSQLAVEEWLLVGPHLELKLPPVNLHRWKLSCCRVRGRVVVRVTLPNGTIQERPLCNARVSICEVDRSIRDIITYLPNDLIFRIRDEFIAAAPRPIPPIPPVTGQFEVLPQVVATQDIVVRTTEHTELHPMPIRNALTKAVEIEPLGTLVGATAVHLIRDALIARLDLLKPIWCLFDWLRPFYTVDCLKTVAVDENGYFDTDIEYPCYGDRPDLYFKVEQDCHPGGWLTVYAPSVHCNTHWDYCCGTPVKIVVTHPSARPGRAPSFIWPYRPGDPASVGSWELLKHDSGVFVVHSALLPTGKVLMFSGTAEANLPMESRVWHPVTDTLTAQSFGDDLFCAGHAMLADGRVLVNGGAIPGQGRGIKATHIFDPVAETWTKVKDMNHARWYPTTLTLPDGRAITFSGRDENAAVVPQVEVYDPAADTWTDLPATANKLLDIYPSLHLMPDGTIFYTGTRWDGSPSLWTAPPRTALFNPSTNVWTDVDDHVVLDRTEGYSVLLPPFVPGPFIHEHDDIPKPPKKPPTLSRVLVVGGHGATAAAEIIDTAEATPTWRRIADMNFPRRNTNGVLLPDGKLLICSGIGHFKWDNDPGYVYEAELFDPQTETWTVMAPMTVGRQYHSVSILLADGRVLNIGSQSAITQERRMEIYSPPYLFRGPRPKISAAPAAVGYGDEFTVESPDTCRIDRIVFMRPSSITHHTNTDQRYLPLQWHQESNCELRVTAPSSSSEAPPGYYLLFILDDCGVPSVARFVCLT